MAVASYFDTVQKLYIAFYQRPADPSGLYYWAQRLDVAGGNQSAVINAFASSAEAVRLYDTNADGAITNADASALIDSVYQALFNRAPDAAGKAFYIDGLTKGTFTVGSVVLDVLNGAKNEDAVAVANKLEYATAFTKTLDPEQDGIGPFTATYNGDDEVGARTLLAAVTNDPTTRKTAAQVTNDVKTVIANTGDSILPTPGPVVGQTFTLTTGLDAVTSAYTTVNGVIDQNSATNSTLTVADQINTGADGILNTTLLTRNSSAVAGISSTGVKTLNITAIDTNSGSSDASSWDLSTHTGLTAVNVKNASVLGGTGAATGADTLTINSFAKAVTLGVVGGNKYQQITTAIVSNDDAGTADQLNVALSSAAKAGTVTLAGNYEKLAVTNDATAAAIRSFTLSGGKLQSATITSAGDLTAAVSGYDSTKTTSLDASGSAGKLKLTISDTLTNNFTSIKGGTGTSDKLVVTTNNTTTSSAVNISGFETVVASNTGTSTVDATNLGATTALGLAYNGGTQLTYSNLADGATLLIEGDGTTGAALTGSAALVGQVKGASSSAPAAAVTVKINNQGTNLGNSGTADYVLTTGAITVNSVKAVTIDAADAAVTTGTITTDVATTLTLKGTSALSVGTIGSASKTTTIDASGVVGKLTATLVGDLANDTTVTLGNGKNALGLGNQTDNTGTATVKTITVNGGTGNETFTLGTVSNKAKLVLNAGAGDDTINADAVSIATGSQGATIDGGTGTNTVTLSTSASAKDASGATFTNISKYQLTGTDNLKVNVASVNGSTSEIQEFSTGKLEVVGTAGADTIDLSKLVITGPNGLQVDASAGGDTVTLSGGADVFYYASALNAGTVSAFTSTKDKINFADAMTTRSSTTIALGTTTLATATQDGALISKAQNTSATTNAVTAANLSDLTKVAALIGDATGGVVVTDASGATDTVLFIVESSDVTGKFGIYSWTGAGANDTSVGSTELTLLGVVTGNAVVAGDFAMV